MLQSRLQRIPEPTPTPALATVDVSRAAIRAASDLFLNAADLVARLTDNDLSLGVVWLTVVERSADRLKRSPEKWAAYIRSGGILPDDERPAVSVYALSHLLDLPYETTRRHVMRLVAMGQLARVRKGVIVPAARMNSPEVRAASSELQARLRRYLVLLDRLGIIRLGPASELAPDTPLAGAADIDPYVDERRRQYSRIAIAYVVEGAKLLAQSAGGNLLQGLLFMAIVQANVQTVTADPALSRRYGAVGDPPPDALRRPISIFALAQSLRIPYETARRNVGQLTANGLAVRVDKGIIVPASVLMSPAILGAAPQSYQLIRSLIQSLAEAGMDIRMA